jgi:prepilin-type N-terminal cleavage/methylation domain-containing protein
MVVGRMPSGGFRFFAEKTMRRREIADTSGFTLIELLVVISIIVILITIITPCVARAKWLAGEKVCSSNLRGLNLGIILYANCNNGFYPLEPTEHNPHPNLVQVLVSQRYAANELFYCPQSFFLETSAQNASYAPVGATDSVINTPENLRAGNISYVYWSFQENKKSGAETWREAANFLPRQLMLDRAVAVDAARPVPPATPAERWVLSDFFRKGAPFPHARSHASGLDVVYQDGHAALIFGSPKTAYR